jgi:dTDP-glucose 4,6-dehydratase
MKYLIIGGAGIFALHTIKKILQLKSTTKVISIGRNRDRSSEAFTLGVGNNDDRYSYKQIHLTFEIDFLTDLIDTYKPDYIINFAALAYATSWNKSSRYYDTNITAVAKLCEHLYDKKFLKQFLQIGSSEIYGGTKEPAKENSLPNPTSPYAVSKLAADYHMLSLYNHMGFPTNVIRPSNCYGSGQYMYRVIPKAILYGLTGKKFPLEGGGKVLKSFMHAGDLADAIITILHSKKFGKIYNAGVHKPNSIREIVESVSKNLKLDFSKFCEITEGRKTEDSQYCIDSSLIKDELGWEAKITLDEGVDEVVQWVKKYQDILIDEPQSFTLRA